MSEGVIADVRRQADEVEKGGRKHEVTVQAGRREQAVLSVRRRVI